MADKTLFIARNDPAKERKRLGKVKDLLEAAIDDAQMYEYDIAMISFSFSIVLVSTLFALLVIEQYLFSDS